MKRTTYPFAAIVGQQELQLAIILNMIDNTIGGLLVRGVKGSGKSTAIYAAGDIMPEIDIIKDCKFNCDPARPDAYCSTCKGKSQDKKPEIIKHKPEIVSIPLSTTEDRLLGNVDVEHLLKTGEYRFVPGILARAHRQVLYIDEVNLLPDHIVDDILDVSATKWNIVEREGFSVSHPSEFLLAGTMNPEEGELRPQILDRFALSVEVKSVKDPVLRKEIINRNIAFQDDPEGFTKEFEDITMKIKSSILTAKSILPGANIGSRMTDAVVDFCAQKDVDGHRADIAIIKSAKAFAAFEGRDSVETRHLQTAAELVLGHRTRQGGLLKPLTKDEISEFFSNLKPVKKENEKPESNLVVNKEINFLSTGELIRQKK